MVKVRTIFSLVREDGLRSLASRAIGRFAVRITRGKLFSRLPVQGDKIMFMTFSNRYECNPKYITEELIRRGTPCDLVWVVRNSRRIDSSGFPSQVHLVKRESLRFFRELATARIWVDNGINCLKVPMRKKFGQVYFETWHGSMGLKRIDGSSAGDDAWQSAVRRTGAATDFCISNSEFETRVFREAYWPDAEILPYGHARNDMLCCNDDSCRGLVREKLAARYGLPTSKRWALYAPTFRDSYPSDLGAIDLSRLSRALKARFGGEWCVLTRLHFHDRKRAQEAWRDEVGHVDVSDYPDMQEILVAVDVGVTDYSSWCCDFVLTGRPCFLFAPDLDQFEDLRGFYYPLSETPFPIACDNAALESAVLDFDGRRYAYECENFLGARGCYEDGRAAERAALKIEQVILRPCSDE